MRFSKLATHEITIVLIVKSFLLYLLWLAFFSMPNPSKDHPKIVQHVFGIDIQKNINVKE